MKNKLILIIVFFISSAKSMALLGTNSSVYESSFCKKWKCVVKNKSTTHEGLDVYLYSIKNVLDFKVYRNNKNLVSVLTSFSGQDDNLYIGSPEYRNLANEATSELYTIITGEYISYERTAEWERLCERAHNNQYKPSEITIFINKNSYLTCSAESHASSNGYGGWWTWDMWLKAR